MFEEDQYICAIEEVADELRIDRFGKILDVLSVSDEQFADLVEMAFHSKPKLETIHLVRIGAIPAPIPWRIVLATYLAEWTAIVLDVQLNNGNYRLPPPPRKAYRWLKRARLGHPLLKSWRLVSLSCLEKR